MSLGGFEDWEEDIEEEETFESFEEATSVRKTMERNPSKLWIYQCKSNFLSAFWNDGDERWCEECDDDLQQYKGLALLKNHQPITVESRKEFYETTNSSGKTKRCERPKQGAWC